MDRSWGTEAAHRSVGLGSALRLASDRSPICASWTKQSPGWLLSSTTTTKTTVLPFQCDDDQFPLLIRSYTPDTENHSQRRLTSISSTNTHKALNANLSGKRSRRRPNENDGRKRNMPRKPMRSSWRRSRALETMEGRRDSSGALRTLAVWSMHTTVPKCLRAPQQGSVDSLHVPVSILKPQIRCLHPRPLNDQRANVPWIPS